MEITKLDFTETYNQFCKSGDFTEVRLERDPYGNIISKLSRDSRVKVQITPRGRIISYFPGEESLIWYKIWAIIRPTLRCIGGETPIAGKQRALHLGREMPTPEAELADIVLGFESEGKLPPDHILMSPTPSPEIAKYYEKFERAAGDWTSEFPPDV